MRANTLARPEQSDFSTAPGQFAALADLICGAGEPVYATLSLSCRTELSLAFNRLSAELQQLAMAGGAQ